MEQLGSGGLVAVYLALDKSLQRYVALKVIREGVLIPNDSKTDGATKADHAARIQQIFQEARAQARVNHPNVVHIYFVDQARDFPFFAMELIRGSTLKHRLANGPLPESSALPLNLPTPCGTPNYLCPEAADQKPVDFRSDMYSLGVTLFELTFGRQPYFYATASVEERLQARQFQPVQFPKEWPETVPAA